MSYQQTLDYLYKNLPMFQRVGAAALKNDLTNTWALCEFLGNPQTKFKSIHIAGTNGKGSSSHMLASVLQSAGYKTGLYTSPHLKEFTERIRINGEEIDKDFVIDFVERVKPAIEQLSPSFFEITVAMAFDYFAQSKIDIAVIEVGLGGRLDSTNVITPMLSLITNISWDHKDLLGDTLQKIASEKAGIIKSMVPVVISERQPETDHVFESKATELSSKIVFASDIFAVERISNEQLQVNGKGEMIHLTLDLRGMYQAKNIKGVLACMDELRSQGFILTVEQVLHGLKNVVTQTGLKGRWQKIGEHPLMICDTGHNEAGIREVVTQISQTPHRKLHIVLGLVKDKDISAVLNLLPKEARYYFCQATIPRAMEAEELAQKAGLVNLKGVIIKDVNEAIRTARKNSERDDLIFIGGSTFVVGEIENL